MQPNIIEMTDDHIPDAWEIVRAYPYFFPEEAKINSLGSFSQWFSDLQGGALAAVNEIGELIGFSCMNDIHNSFGHVNIAFKRRTVNPVTSRHLAMDGLKMFFVEHNLKMIYGITSVINFACLRFLKALGFIFTGILPEYGVVNGKRSDYVFASLLREAVV